MNLPQLSAVEAAIERLSAKLQTVECQPCAIAEAAGRIVAEDVLADRDSPPLDVSAMDGYAFRLDDWDGGMLPVQATAAAGRAPLQLLPGTAIRIFTGAAIPAGADCVIRREDTQEFGEQVRLTVARMELQSGQNIRRRGENSLQGVCVLAAGQRIDAASIAALATFGGQRLTVRRKVRVAVLNTGDELVEPGAAVEDWQIRDSNGPTLHTWLTSLPWVEVVARQRVQDTLDGVRQALQTQLANCDAILLTGGVSMGDTDFVPAAIELLGGEIVFHRLPIRPGKPVLGAVLNGKLLLGLPGNPVSVAVTSRVFGEPLLRRLAGCSSRSWQPLVELSEVDDKRLDLTWYRLVHIADDGQVHLVTSQGSGDVVSLSRSSGFVEVTPGARGDGPVRLSLW